MRTREIFRPARDCVTTANYRTIKAGTSPLTTYQLMDIFGCTRDQAYWFLMKHGHKVGAKWVIGRRELKDLIATGVICPKRREEYADE